MTWITYRPNVADKRKDQLIYVGSAESVNEALERAFGEKKPTEPFVVQVNGVPFLRADWGKPIPADSSLEVLVAPGDVATGVLTALTVASLLVTAYVMAKVARLSAVATGATVPEQSPAFTFAGQKNIQRLNNTLDCVFGRVRWWPAYLCSPYVTYAKNKPTLHVKLSLGLGNFDIESVLVHDIPIGNIVGAAVTQHDCGGFTSSSGSYDGVYYAEEIANSEILATDEDGHTGLGSFTLNPSNTVADKIVLNFNYGSGLCGTSNGGYAATAVTIRCIINELDVSGIVTGRKQTIDFTHTGSTTSATRITETVTPSAVTFVSGTGRYSIYVVRTNSKNASIGAQDRCTLESVFALCASGNNYKSVTVLDIHLPGTAVVGADAAEKVNVVATRKLQPIIDGVLSSEVATTNPAWAALYALTSTFGAGIPSSDLDLAYWEALAKEWQLRSFSYRFEQETTVWDVLQAIAVATRSSLYRVGADVRFATISPVKPPVALFTPDTATDLELNFGFRVFSENDCVEAAYIDTETGLQDSVFFTPPGSTASNPSKVTYAGVTNRQEAWRLAAYDYMVQTLARDTARFTVGLDGQIPLRGDVVLVSWPFPSWDASGVVVSAVIDGTGLPTLTLSDDVPYENGWLALRKSNGATWGPVRFTRTAARTVTSTSSLNFSFDFSGETREPIAYTLGTDTIVTKRFSVTETSLGDDDLVTVEAEEFNPSVFCYDNRSVPTRGMDMLPAPEVTSITPWLRVLDESGQYLRVEVGPVYGTTVTPELHYLYLSPESTNATAYADPAFYRDELLAAPVATLVGAACYIPRQVGNLFLLLVSRNTITHPSTGTHIFVAYNFWRGCIGTFGTDTSHPLFSLLFNNCDGVYVSPGSQDNKCNFSFLFETAAIAQATTLAPVGTAVFDVNERELVLLVNCPPDAAVNVEVKAVGMLGSQAAYTFTTADGGYITISEEALRTAGVLDVRHVASRHPTVTIKQWVTGQEAKATTITLDIKPLKATPVKQSLKFAELGGSTYTRFYFPELDIDVSDFVTFDYRISLVDGYSGARSYRWCPLQQRSDSAVAEQTSRAVIHSLPEYNLPWITRPHFSDVSLRATTDGLWLDATPRYGNVSTSALSIGEFFFVAAFNKNMIRISDTVPWVIFRPVDTDDVHRYIRDVVRDVRRLFYLRVAYYISGDPAIYFRDPTASERADLADVEMLYAYREARFFRSEAYATGRGGASCTMLDMFGTYGDNVSTLVPLPLT